MRTLVFINPLKPGKMKEYKAFSAENTGPRKKEYIDLLMRYKLNNAKVYHHKLGGKEFIIVVHDADDDALEHLAKFAASTNPYDRWFMEQLNHMHEFHHLDGEPLAKHLFTFDVKHPSNNILSI